MEQITIELFTDPMMGLSYESEPVYRKLETHFGDRLRFRYRMGWLVRNVYDLVNPVDLKAGREHAIERYNGRLADIYRSEEAIGGLPIVMDYFHLFSVSEDSSKPLNIAFKSFEILAPDLAEQFLYKMRYGIIVENRMLLKIEEIVKLVLDFGIDTDAFLKCYHGAAQKAFEADISEMEHLGIRHLPACRITYGNKSMAFLGVLNYEFYVNAIRNITEGKFVPEPIQMNDELVCNLFKKHPLISVVELREALDFSCNQETFEYVSPILRRMSGVKVF